LAAAKWSAVICDGPLEEEEEEEEEERWWWRKRGVI